MANFQLRLKQVAGESQMQLTVNCSVEMEKLMVPLFSPRVHQYISHHFRDCKCPWPCKELPEYISTSHTVPIIISENKYPWPCKPLPFIFHSLPLSRLEVRHVHPVSLELVVVHYTCLLLELDDKDVLPGRRQSAT